MEPIRATYRLSCSTSGIEARAEALSREQTTELPRGAAPRAAEARVEGRVSEVRRVDERSFDVEIALPAVTQDGSASQLLNVLFGNASLQDDVLLVDAAIPGWLVERFPGPRHGAAGIRRLTGVTHRALTCTALKPQGLAPSALRSLCETFARAGIDVVKDDHGLAEQGSARFEDRVRACMEGLETVREETGQTALYAPSLSGGPSDVRRQLAAAAACGVRAVLIAPMLLGASLLAEIAAAEEGPVLIAHPALAGTRISPALLLGRLFRLFGADAVIFPHRGGRFDAFDASTCREIARRLEEDAGGGVLSAMPVPAGGVDAERARDVVAFYGSEVMLLVGGSLYRGGDDLAARTRRFVDAVARASEDHG